MKRVAINGFGRIGRAFLKLSLEQKDIEVVAINDLMDLESAAYLLKYDTVYGTLEKNVSFSDKTLLVGDKKIKWLNQSDPSSLPWSEEKIDVVLESTGVFNDYDKAYAHIKAGAKHTIITAPVKKDSKEGVKSGTILIGVNEDSIKTKEITSNASCTTNAVGLPMKIIDEFIGVKKAILNTIHAYTASQPIVDSDSRKSDKRSKRAGAQNIIPSTTGAAIATTKVLEGLEGKFDGIAMRVPVVSGSIADITFIAKRNTSVEEVNKILKVGENSLFKTTTDPIVSSDVIGQKYVAIADLSLTTVVGGDLVKVLFWYDNEMGYTSSLIEHVRQI